MRKIATLALASALSIAAIAPAAFAKPADCTGKDFAASMKVAAQNKDLKGSEKNAWASVDCRHVEETVTTSTTICKSTFGFGCNA